MKRKLIISSFAFFFAALVFSGCTKKVTTTDIGANAKGKEDKTAEAVKPDVTEGFKNGAVASTETGAGQSAKGAVPANTAVSLSLSDVYFDFDRYIIREDARGALEKDARMLKDNKDLSVVIEGRCDERGSDEYNLALGDRRADSVKKYLTDLGVDPGRISTVSYGNEKPFCREHNEECWQKNRTAHFVRKN